MKVVQPASDQSAEPEASSRASCRHRITAVAVFVALVCSGATSCTRTQVALSSAAIAAVVVGTTVGVTYAVKHHHHTLQGCVFSDASGLKLRTSDAKVYTLKGDAASIKVGDSVKFHGSKVKKAKGDSTGDQVFVVQKLSKDYGPCPVNVATSPTPTR
jgi:hypothetical protein